MGFSDLPSNFRSMGRGQQREEGRRALARTIARGTGEGVPASLFSPSHLAERTAAEDAQQKKKKPSLRPQRKTSLLGQGGLVTPNIGKKTLLG